VAKSTPSNIGPYRLLNVVHTGQNCHIWQAFDDENQRIVGIKTLLDRFQQDREQIGLLRWEYTVGHSVRDLRIIEVYDFGIDRGTTYLSMEWLPVQNLKQRMNAGVEKVFYLYQKIIEEAALSLSHFHKKGWVHRDIKPDNFLVSDDAGVKLIDFALARRRRARILKLITPRTKVQGTRSYMSPEQIRGQLPDIRSDIYSFGCMLFEMMADKPPFTGTSSNDLLNKHLYAAPPSMEAANPNATPEFASLVRKMMAKETSKRPQTMEDFLGEYRLMRIFKSLPKPPAG
jgi:eukaryotic-like serine/threonine-protein kinase